MTIKGRKQRNTIVLDVEPDLPDGTEVEVIVPAALGGDTPPKRLLPIGEAVGESVSDTIIRERR